jgi:putative two-component system response regulator
MSHEKCVQIIQDECGTHFDPDLVAAFLRRADEFLEIRNSYGDDVREMTADDNGSEDEG